MKERILAQSRQEIYRSGFRFTMADLAKQCGLSTKTLYECFSSKEELITELIRLSIDELTQKGRTVLNDPKLDPMAKLHELLVMLPRDYHFFDIKRLHELQRYYPQPWSLLDSFLTTQWDDVAQVLAEAQREGLIEPIDINLFIQLYIGGLYRMMEQVAEKGVNLTLHEALEQMVNLLEFGIRKR